MVKVIWLQTALMYTFHKSVILGLPQTERKILEAMGTFYARIQIGLK